MRSFLATLTLAILVACGGGSSSSSGTGSGGPPPPPPPTSKPMPRITLQAPHTGPMQPTAQAPIGTVTPTMIVTDWGVFYYETSDFQFAKGTMLVDGQGNVTVQGATLTSPAGSTQDFLFTGTYLNGVLSGSSNAGAVNLANTTLQGVSIDLTAVAGNYVSHNISTGLITYMVLNPDGTFTASDYVDMAHYPQFFSGQWTGKLTGGGPVGNSLGAEASYLASAQPSSFPATFGYAMFQGTDLLLFSANTINDTHSMQFSGVFNKQ
ncbi:MAG TPA: hypothetical protein VFF76_09695 [Holophagaceae bacterium]|jgi:hypothetical protein|nr:hypothetical protein [Holophagaceae bacterium]